MTGEQYNPRDAVFHIWEGFFYVFFRWTKERTEKWATKYDAIDLSNPDSFFYHDTALTHVTDLLIPLNLRKNLGVYGTMRFADEIETAICFERSHTGRSLLDDTYSWEAAKQRSSELRNS